MTKTNALRILDSAGIAYCVHEYDTSDGRIDGVSVAAKIGKDPELVFKTLVTTGKLGLKVFIIPVKCALDLKKAASVAGDKYVELVKSRELLKLTGYVHGGCSPLGMKKQFPTFIEETAQILDTIIVSAGRIGLQMELSPEDLTHMTGAIFGDLIDLHIMS